MEGFQLLALRDFAQALAQFEGLPGEFVMIKVEQIGEPAESFKLCKIRFKDNHLHKQYVDLVNEFGEKLEEMVSSHIEQIKQLKHR